MSTIVMKMKDGTVKDFPESYRAGGSYHTTIRYEGAFAIVKNAYGTETAVPAQDIEEVSVMPTGGW